MQIATASELKIAVASNFLPTMKVLVDEYKTKSKTKIHLSSGSTGRHYAQIIHGAPYDLFFAADTKRPKLLDEKKLIYPNSRFTYAIGKLALLAKGEFKTLNEALLSPKVKRIAVANPKLAPYGWSTKQFLNDQNLWGKVRHKIIKGENIAQALHFYTSGNAQATFIAKSQISKISTNQEALFSIKSSSSIIQQAVILKPSKEAKDFVNFIQSNVARDIIIKSGYDLMERTK